MQVMDTIMTRRSRNRKRRRQLRQKATKPPSLKSLLAWTVPLALIAGCVDWFLYRHMADHHDKYGHWYLPMQGFIFAVMVTGIAVTIPIVGILQRRASRKSQ